ncbi:DUF5839 family protein [Salimicrobium salexigens]|uniref:Primosomal protein N' 3' DNA-binding domain-containing protein n=1 Tax=Salimicrobium salexigens TaxID=908941 RepID=A0ABY1KPJ1_9BACI|nr:DUF5839 family protein [Salimicrobium salexigens]SIS57534.1 hypothetical protein SAMN05421758_102390 [Salimicrobium salexigens]
MKINNTIAAYHIVGMENGALKLNTNKLYHWNIPKRLRENPIQKGDIVLVPTGRGKRRVLVMDVFREEFEETQNTYKKVIKVIEKAPTNERSAVIND